MTGRTTAKPVGVSEGIAGVDEVGRGPLAGPVVAAAVILDSGAPIAGLADSKRLTPKRRQVLAEQIKAHSRAWAIGRAEVEEVDAINVLQASLLAMQRAVAVLDGRCRAVVVDGCHAPRLDCPVDCVVGGDATVPAISAASILAKVERDTEMLALDSVYPQYGFASHKGYPTAKHIEALALHGVSPVHRRSFAPVARLLGAG